jgi:hypothetical protein
VHLFENEVQFLLNEVHFIQDMENWVKTAENGVFLLFFGALDSVVKKKPPSLRKRLFIGSAGGWLAQS